MPFLMETQELTCQRPQTVEPSQARQSGWHALLSQTNVAERWFWDADLEIWRLHPRAFEAETPAGMSCLGYVYLAEDRGNPSTQSGPAR